MDRFEKRCEGVWAWGLVLLIAAHLALGLVNLIATLSPMLGDLSSYNEAQFRMNLRVSYSFVQFIQKETPENSTLLLGPSWYPAHALYFFYPRHLIYGGASILRDHPEIEYIVIDDGFPDFDVAGEKVMLDSERGIVQVRRGQ